MKIIDYLPEVLKEIYEFRALGATEDIQLEAVKDSVNSLEKELFITTAEGIGLERWEEALGIVVMPTYSAQYRRFKILSVLFGGGNRLIAMLDGLVGRDNYSVDYYWNEFKIKVRLALGRKDMLEALNASLEKLLPLNLAFECTLKYRTWNTASAYTWEKVSEITWTDLAEKEYLEGADS